MMSSLQVTTEIDVWVLDLFQEMLHSNMLLTLEQYNLVRQAISQGFGLGGWDDLEGVCRLIWVKPDPLEDATRFEQAFERFRQRHEKVWFVLDDEKVELQPEEEPSEAKSVLPRIPPRVISIPEHSLEKKVPVAAKTMDIPRSNQGKKEGFKLRPTQLPLSLREIRNGWKMLCKTTRTGTLEELDLEATLHRFEQDGFWADVVLRPAMTRKMELLLLVDEHTTMIPYRLALEPILKAFAQNKIGRSRIYRFSIYPSDPLFDWKHSARSAPISHILSQCHQNRTIALIWSDAGAASRTYDKDRVEGTVEFLSRLQSCVRQVIWLNPLPAERWLRTSAHAIALALDGQMVTIQQDCFKSVFQVCQRGVIFG
jgi:uncharacterized protein